MGGNGVWGAHFAFIRGHEGGPKASSANQSPLAPRLTPAQSSTSLHARHSYFARI